MSSPGPARDAAPAALSLSVEEYAPGAHLPEAWLAAVREMVAQEYFRYPYADQIGTPDRHRFVAIDGGGRAVGYASYRIHGQYAYCANLLVSPSARGQGVGRRTDEARFRSLRHLGKRGYVSCLCEDTYSQRLKAALGLRPVNVKFGHQIDFTAAGRVGSAVLFAEGPFPVEPPLAQEIIVDEHQKRVRILWPDGAPLDGLPTPEDGYYREVNTGLASARTLARGSDWIYTGLDLDLRTGRWHCVLQLRNRRFHQGHAAAPAMIAPFPQLITGLAAVGEEQLL